MSLIGSSDHRFRSCRCRFDYVKRPGLLSGQPGRTAGPGWVSQYPFVAGRVLAVHNPRDACLISLPELAARGHLNKRIQSFSTAIASPLLRARPVSTVTQGAGCDRDPCLLAVASDPEVFHANCLWKVVTTATGPWQRSGRPAGRPDRDVGSPGGAGQRATAAR